VNLQCSYFDINIKVINVDIEFCLSRLLLLHQILKIFCICNYFDAKNGSKYVRSNGCLFRRINI
jgi:hypothetical protein